MSVQHVTRHVCDQCGHAEDTPRRDADRPTGWWVVSWQIKQGGAFDVLVICPSCVRDFNVWRNALKGGTR